MKQSVSLTAKTFQRILLRWFDRYGRKDLPWQKDKTPYRIWVSEIMLQQTQVSTVISYYERFLAKFPDVGSLANADEDTIFHIWTGLGYYHRAKHLKIAAKKIFEDFNNRFPDELTELEKLPGIGRSTAGAILSIAFNKKAPILDGNVKRVLTRLHGITEWPGEKKVTESLWKLAEHYTPDKRCADYTQAIMDLGATLCTRSKPSCTTCPFEKYCVAHAKGLEKTLPQAKPRKTLPIKQASLLILQKEPHFVLLVKRPPAGVWAGLWSLPEVNGTPSAALIRKTCSSQLKLRVKSLQFGDAFRHTFTHYHLDILPVFLKIDQSTQLLMDDQQKIWYNLRKSQLIGMPAPVKLLLSKLEKST